MSTRKHLRIYAFEKTGLGEKLAGYAALFNGGHHQYGLEGLAIIAESDILQSPYTNEGITVTKFPTSITIDKTNKEGETVCIMAIELVEILEMKPEPGYEPEHLIN